MVNGEKDMNVKPLGICQHFLMLLMNNLIVRGIKQATLPRQSVEVHFEDPPGISHNSTLKTSSSRSNGEILIDFNHSEAHDESSNNRSVRVQLNKVGPTPHPDKKKEADARFRGDHRALPATTPVSGGKIEKVHNTARTRKNDEEDGAILIHHQITDANDPAHQQPITKPQRPSRPPQLTAALSSINEKADAFIRSRKEAMSKHCNGFHPNKSS